MVWFENCTDQRRYLCKKARRFFPIEWIQSNWRNVFLADTINFIKVWFIHPSYRLYSRHTPTWDTKSFSKMPIFERFSVRKRVWKQLATVPGRCVTTVLRWSRTAGKNRPTNPGTTIFSISETGVCLCLLMIRAFQDQVWNFEKKCSRVLFAVFRFDEYRGLHSARSETHQGCFSFKCVF